jgi:hypothetical protein
MMILFFFDGNTNNIMSLARGKRGVIIDNIIRWNLSGHFFWSFQKVMVVYLVLSYFNVLSRRNYGVFRVQDSWAQQKENGHL